MIKLLRIDHRLLHGQVAVNWTASVGADCILIANDGVMGDELRKTTLRLAAPHGVKVVIKNVADSIQSINSGVTDKYKLMIVVETVADAAKLTAGCGSVKSVNLGNVKKRDGTQKFGNSQVYCTPEELQLIRGMIDSGVEVELRQLPNHAKVLAQKLL